MSVDSQTHNEQQLAQQDNQDQVQQVAQDTASGKKPDTSHSESSIQSLLCSPTDLGAHLAAKLLQRTEETLDETESSPASNESDSGQRRRTQEVDAHLTALRINIPAQAVNAVIHRDASPDARPQRNPETQQPAQNTSGGTLSLPSTSEFNNLQYLISTNLQSLTNFIATMYSFYITFQLVSGIKADVDAKFYEKIHDLTIDIALCRENFELNKCFKDTVVPAVRGQCIEWEKCMSKDPFSTSGKAVITAQSLGMIVNAFLEPITIHSCLILLIAIPALFLVNVSFGFLRAKIYINNTPARARQP